MKRTRVKICCIGNPAEAEMAIAAGADALGLVAAMPSGPGPISDEAIARIVADVPPPTATFLLTCEIEAHAIADHVRRTGANTVQVVNHIDARESERLAVLLPTIRRVQVLHVEDHTVLDLADAYSPFVHALLLDSGRPSAAVPELGGTGRVHDWAISADLVRRSPRPVFLAGGLTPDNVGTAIREVQPFGLDLCSSVRTHGHLDSGKLATFMEAVRRADVPL